MKRTVFKIAMVAVVLASAFTSCTKDLDRLPQNEITAEQVFTTPQG